MRDPSEYETYHRGKQVISSKFSFAVCASLVCLTSAAGQDEKSISIERGSKVYYTYCVSCHGVSGEGNGRGAAKLQTPPANFTRSIAADAYVETIIRKGGEQLGRSSAMPPWEDELSNENIKDVISFVNSFKRS
jgi:mono/diheme cytochrome c family protein